MEENEIPMPPGFDPSEYDAETPSVRILPLKDHHLMLYDAQARHVARRMESKQFSDFAQKGVTPAQYAEETERGRVAADRQMAAQSDLNRRRQAAYQGLGAIATGVPEIDRTQEMAIQQRLSGQAQPERQAPTTPEATAIQSGIGALAQILGAGPEVAVAVQRAAEIQARRRDATNETEFRNADAEYRRAREEALSALLGERQNQKLQTDAELQSRDDQRLGYQNELQGIGAEQTSLDRQTAIEGQNTRAEETRIAAELQRDRTDTSNRWKTFLDQTSKRQIPLTDAEWKFAVDSFVSGANPKLGLTAADFPVAGLSGPTTAAFGATTRRMQTVAEIEQKAARLSFDQAKFVSEFAEKKRHNRVTEGETKRYHDILDKLGISRLDIAQQNADTAVFSAATGRMNAQTTLDKANGTLTGGPGKVSHAEYDKALTAEKSASADLSGKNAAWRAGMDAFRTSFLADNPGATPKEIETAMLQDKTLEAKRLDVEGAAGTLNQRSKERKAAQQRYQQANPPAPKAVSPTPGDHAGERAGDGRNVRAGATRTAAFGKEMQSRFGGSTTQYADRNIAGSDTKSEHSSGNAIDHFATPKVMRRMADALVNDPRVYRVIYNRRIWDPKKGWHAYDGENPHVDHVHYELIGGGGSKPSAAPVRMASASPKPRRVKSGAKVIKDGEIKAEWR